MKIFLLWAVLILVESRRIPMIRRRRPLQRHHATDSSTTATPHQQRNSLRKARKTAQRRGHAAPWERILENVFKSATKGQKYRYLARVTTTTTTSSVSGGGGRLRHHCNGVLISDRIVLTAASCLWDMNHGGVRSDLYGALVGVACEDDDDDGKVDNCGQPFVSTPITNVWVHPDWKPKKLSLNIGLVRLAAPVPAKVAVPAIPDVVADYYWAVSGGYAVDLKSIVLGAQNVQELPVDFVPSEECVKSWGTSLVQDDKVCVASSTPAFAKDLCEMDGGGPTIVPRTDGPDIVVGVASFGSLRCSTTTGQMRPHVLARVSAGADFIAHVTCYPGLSDKAPAWCSSVGYYVEGQEEEEEEEEEGSKRERPDFPSPYAMAAATLPDPAAPPKCNEGNKTKYRPNVSANNRKSCRGLKHQSTSKIKKVCSNPMSDAGTNCCNTCAESQK